ncbi:ABC transporter substrate-binding protein [Devosia pacifica]|uniref:ABC transporter substrate-binding protein n=1 Tax=Devosia pacifica TaxID=1335967 RepID=A0A918S125_9HYPH|nr:ABC transporter substrate-binding protein [Devosia pacifica]GHA19184.1 ABC transporter substrate-binding protein [Devosia pacifica]
MRLTQSTLGQMKALVLAGAAALITTMSANAQSTVTVAMTAGDIPDWSGQPDQGFEGYRFVGYSLYDGLLAWDLSSTDEEVDVVPGLATSYEVDPDNPKRWIFDLRQGVTFHDGCEWNADVAVWNIERLINEAHPAFNPAQFARARSRTSNIAGAEKIDEATFAITTSDEESLFPYNLPYVFMVSQCAVEEAGNDWAAYSDNPSGTGPYVFESVVPHERLVLAKNENYWNEDRIPKHDKLVLMPMPEATTRASALLSGQVNFIEAPSPDMIPALEGAGMNVVTNVYPHTWPYLFNTMEGAFTDKRIRQAANYAVDREAMLAMLGGVATESYGAYIPEQENYGDVFVYEHDVEKARSLLEEAGCMPCEIKVAISTSGSGQMQPLPMNELVKAQLEEAGFEVNFEVIDWNTMITMFQQGAVAYPDYDAINFSSAVMEPFSFVRGFMSRYQSPNGGNWGGYSNPEVDDLLEQALTTYNIDEQNELIREAHEMITEDAARLFIVSDLNPRALAPNLSGFVQAQSWFQDMTPIIVE